MSNLIFLTYGFYILPFSLLHIYLIAEISQKFALRTIRCICHTVCDGPLKEELAYHFTQKTINVLTLARLYSNDFHIGFVGQSQSTLVSNTLERASSLKFPEGCTISTIMSGLWCTSMKYFTCPTVVIV